MNARHRAERLVPFTDAVVAIAITLLVLPLVDVANQAVARASHPTAGDLRALLGESAGPLLGFAISFFVIARLWWSHHGLFEHVDEWTTAMVVVNTVWLFTIVLLPWATVLSTSFLRSPVVNLLYIGDMTLASALQTLLALLIVRDEATPDVPSRLRLYGNLTSLVAFVAALAVSVAVPQAYDWPLLLLVLTGLVDRVVRRRVEGAGGGPEGAAA